MMNAISSYIYYHDLSLIQFHPAADQMTNNMNALLGALSDGRRWPQFDKDAGEL